MEVFTSLKFWLNFGADSTARGVYPDIYTSNTSIKTTTTTATTDVRNLAVETDDETDEEDSFFDLVFETPDCAKSVDIDRFENDEDSYTNLSKRDGEIRSNFVESPNDVFHQRKALRLEQQNSKPQSPISLLRSPPKFRVLLLGFKKSKLEKSETNNNSTMATPNHHSLKSSPQKEVPIVPFFTRDNSLRSKLQTENSEDLPNDDSSKRFPKYTVQKYLKLIKPLYVRVSKRYNEKMRFSGQLTTVTPLSPAAVPACSPRKQGEEKQGSRAAVFREVCKHLGKSRSSSSAVGIMPAPVSRRDDSILQQQDGIQSAILHCKRSYSSSSRDRSLLSRSASDSYHEKSIIPPGNSNEDEKRSSI